MNKLLTLLLLVAMPLAAADLKTAAWLGGCWSYDDSDPGSGEVWMPPVAGSMFAVSRSTKAGKTVAFEYLRIIQDADGAITLFASPGGKEAVRFELVKISDREIAFENSAHDFPQHISYHRGDADELLGHIEGQINGEFREVDFPMTRVDCDSFMQ